MTASKIPTAILGGSGYVAGELLRLLLAHPHLEPVAVASTSQANEPVVRSFPNLKGSAAEALTFVTLAGLAERVAATPQLALFAATPHGATATLLDSLMHHAEQAGTTLYVVDLSADFRFTEASRYAAIYGKPHPAPARLSQFTCAVPEHFQGRPAGHATQPGCFTTASICAAMPFVALRLVEGPIFVSAITGSTGSGRTPGAGTHHPERRSNLHAYNVLGHRHEAEMRLLLGRASDAEPEVEFVPHSGPFARGIHATVRLTLVKPTTASELAERAATYYQDSSFVRVSTTPVRLVDVIGTNRCEVSVFTRGRTLVVTSVIDNLIKGAAGGGIQWMNRLLGFPDSCGLPLSGLGWL